GAAVGAAAGRGVVSVRPALCGRAGVGGGRPRGRDRARRWQRVAREAAKQSGRAIVPEVEMPRPLAECLGLKADLALCLWEGGGESLGSVLAAARTPGSATVIVGTEVGVARPASH